MLLAVTFILFLGILIITHEFGHFIMAKLFKLRVDEFAFGFPPRLWKKKKGDTTYSANLLPFGGYVKIYGEHAETADPKEDPKRAFYAQPAWKRSVVIVAGIVMNFIVGWIAFSILLFIQGVHPVGVRVHEVIPGSPADQAGFLVGERIEGFTEQGEFIKYVADNEGTEITVNGKTVVPRVDPPPGEGRIGLILENIHEDKYQFFKSLWYGLSAAGQTVWAVFTTVGDLIASVFRGQGGEVLNSLSGPVGIVGELGNSMERGGLMVVQFLGLLSLNLAVFNLLPVPALDGGRLLFVIIEKIIGRRMRAKHEAIANVVGFLLLILLALVVTGNDIFKLFADKV